MMIVDSKRMGLAAAGLVSAGALSLALAGCSGGEAGAPAEESTVRVVNVEVLEVAPGTFVERLAVTGDVKANRDVVVAAEESGVIRQVMLDKGAVVRSGQPIARIDDRVLRSQVEQARAAADLAQETYTRRKRLWEEDRVGSELAYLESRYGAEQAVANLNVLRERLERTVVRAPIAGILDDRMIEVGSMVAPGTPVARVVDVSRLKVAAGVPERYAGLVTRGRTVQVGIEGSGAAPVEAEVSYVGATVSADSRTFPIEVIIDNPGGRLKPEMVASIRLPLREWEDAVVVPQEALVRAEGGFVAYVVVERDGVMVAQARPVEVAASQQNRVVVRGGLEEGDLLIVVGQQQVSDGDAVSIVGGEEPRANGEPR